MRRRPLLHPLPPSDPAKGEEEEEEEEDAPPTRDRTALKRRKVRTFVFVLFFVSFCLSTIVHLFVRLFFRSFVCLLDFLSVRLFV